MRSVTPRPRGTTLPELLVAVVLLGLLATFLVTAVRGAARAGQRVQQVASQRRAMITLTTLFRRDLGEAAQGDIGLVTPQEIRYPHPLAAALACRRSDSTVTLRDRDWTAERQAVAGRDSVRVLADPDSAWTAAALIATWASMCDGEASTTYHVDRQPGQPVAQFYEMVRVAIYPSGGRAWLGMLTTGAGIIQPFAGPVVPVVAPWTIDSSGFTAAVSFNGPLGPRPLRLVLSQP